MDDMKKPKIELKRELIIEVLNHMEIYKCVDKTALSPMIPSQDIDKLGCWK